MSAHLSYPPCPRCERQVEDVSAEGAVEVPRFGQMTSVFIPSMHPFTLIPCGHEVAGFRADASGVREWYAERQRL